MMEDILMGSDSDSDADDGVGNTDAHANTTAAPPPTATNSSKSELNNRLKMLYASSSTPKAGRAPPPTPIHAAASAPSHPRNIPPTMNVARTGGPSSSHNPNYVPPMIPNQQGPAKPDGSSRSQDPYQKQPMATTATSAQSRPRADGSSRSQVVNQYQKQPNPLMTTSKHSTNSSARSSGQSLNQTEQQRKEKAEKERFFMFVKVLMEYLKKRDQKMHAEAQAKIKECYAKFQGGDPAYKSLTQSLHSHLKATQKEARAGENHMDQVSSSSVNLRNIFLDLLLLTDTQKKKDKEEAAKKRRNAIAKAKRAAQKREGCIAEERSTTGWNYELSSAHTSTTPAVPSSSVMPAAAKGPKEKSTKASVTKKKKAETSYKFKDNVDHAFLIDVKSIPNIISKDHKMDLNLDEEQRILLYGDQQQREKAGIPQLPWELPAVHQGWGERNLLSVRTVWAKVRLPESELQQVDKLQQAKSIETEANTHSGMISSRIASTHIEARAPTRLEDDTTNHVWHNEARAEQDPTLALLNPNSTSGKPPPALIRLGCDVRRQLALADGNAVKTYQPEDPKKMILEATSMADLSRQPPLKTALSDADSEAKRRFEVFAGKDIQEPPFGRVPKKAKVILTDLSLGASNEADGGKSNACIRLVLGVLPLLGCNIILAVLYLLQAKLGITMNDSSVSQALADYEPNLEFLSTTCGMKALNSIAAFANITAYAGFVLLALFPVDAESERDRQLHNVGSYLYFGLSGLYGLLHTFLLWKQTQYPSIIKVMFTIVPLVTIAFSITYVVKMEEAYMTEWITVALGAIFVGLMSLLFCVDPVDDELIDFFCCRRGGDKSRVRTDDKRKELLV
ncbi:hypothetical protein QTG54_002460 [Skeletonema marinoi]|uniref:Uncharacterized protein n=1 Tax=Skeletonema marinoi TaxID=267567 RepID=A0AAD9DGP9_9STRA|nr:hypothetical protein QTG54_002460 [Skeletonema marinoi]